MACGLFVCAHFNFCAFHFMFRKMCTQATNQHKKRCRKKNLIYFIYIISNKSAHTRTCKKQSKRSSSTASTPTPFSPRRKKNATKLRVPSHSNLFYLFNLIVTNCILRANTMKTYAIFPHSVWVTLLSFVSFCANFMSKFYSNVILHNKRNSYVST